ncbi:hypothetical protein C1645_815477 [Glomus cerebriforme]|uniref:Protein kinase domain-containing protein n=1 Tax=Glomus cerebriforme TaxID=658196 RepID=A0A397TMQ3_9GLOM|nr:hypothetical protein C1645_815477 [Glomus cerebriforme]
MEVNIIQVFEYNYDVLFFHQLLLAVPILFLKNNPHIITLPPLCFTVGTIFLTLNHVPGVLQTQPGPSFLKIVNAKHFQQNFKNWTSENHYVDNLIQRVQLKARNYCEALEWIEYNRFENVEYLAKGNFGTTYKAICKIRSICYWVPKNNRWERYKNQEVALKCLHNSQGITIEFLKEVEKHVLMGSCITHCYGISKDSKTNNFIMVMEFKDSLNEIHKLIHQNFHCGNILVKESCGYILAFITDFGLYRPANVKPTPDNKQIYEVLPYVVPEVLRGNILKQNLLEPKNAYDISESQNVDFTEFNINFEDESN